MSGDSRKEHDVTITSGAPTVVRVRAELRDDSDHVATARPRLSWQTVTESPDWQQARAEIMLDDDARTLVTRDGGDSVLVAWPFEPIEPHARHSVRVRVTGTDGVTSGWSEPRPIFAAFLAPGEWTARWIAHPAPAGHAQPISARRTFRVRSGVRRATLSSSAQGVFRAELDGVRLDADEMKPGWTSYAARIVHETHDVTELLTPGEHAIGLRAAGGWFTERYGPTDDSRVVYGDQPAVAAQLRVEYVDGEVETFVTDASWRVGDGGGLRASGLYDGEDFDARADAPGWSAPGFDDGDWLAAVEVAGIVPEARMAPAVRIVAERPVESVLRAPDGSPIVDFGQNLVGRLRIRVRGERGQTIVLHHAEVLENGDLATRPLRSAKVTDRYTLAGDGEEVWEPEFTFHGFRYARITGWPGDFDPADVTAVIMQSDMRRTGWFTSSSPLLDRLHENVVWSMRGNFLALPTDCPQRDERYGWTGDIQVFAPTASFLYDSEAFLHSWLRDLAIEQRSLGGVVPLVVPSILEDPVPIAAWGDAATIVPTVLTERFGDDAAVQALDSMRAWVDYVDARCDTSGLWHGDTQLGDWLDPTAAPDAPGDAATSPDIVANAYLYRSAVLTAEAAGAAGETNVAAHYDSVADRVRTAYVREFVGPGGVMSSDAQTAYALSIVFGLVDGDAATAMGVRLAELTRAQGYRIGTGFVGTPLLSYALTETGQIDAAASLLFQQGCPSWLYPVTMGATTIWERWDSMREDGSVNPGEMTSFNHYALGAVADWLHRVVAGISPGAPGYRVLAIDPVPIPGLDHAGATHDTPYGRAESAWRRTADGVEVTVVVPPNTRADVRLPDGSRHEVGSGRHQWLSAHAAHAL